MKLLITRFSVFFTWRFESLITKSLRVLWILVFGIFWRYFSVSTAENVGYYTKFARNLPKICQCLRKICCAGYNENNSCLPISVSFWVHIQCFRPNCMTYTVGTQNFWHYQSPVELHLRSFLDVKWRMGHSQNFPPWYRMSYSMLDMYF